jgi:amidase
MSLAFVSETDSRRATEARPTERAPKTGLHAGGAGSVPIPPHPPAADRPEEPPVADRNARELMFTPATELAALVRSGELSAGEVVQAALARIAELDPQINAFVDVDAEGALATAAQIRPGDERPFAGVPIAIKNNRAVNGMRLTYASGLAAKHVADHDHNVTRRLRAAGFVVVGTTAMPEYGIVPTTESRLLGPTRNPWDTSRTSGGSSGGAAAAVAAGMLPIAHGNDGGGSTRIPAACCGLVGLKPQRNRISQAPELGESFLSIDGVISRTVHDTARALDVLAGYELGDANWAPPPRAPFAVTASEAPAPLRIGLAINPVLPDAPLHETVLTAARDTARLLESLGHAVEEAEPPWSDPSTLALFTLEFATGLATAIAWSGRVAGREPAASDIEALSWNLYELARSTSAVDAAQAGAQLRAVARRVVSWLDRYDMLLTPMLAEPPLPLGEIDADGPNPMGAFARAGAFTPFAAMYNVSGQPAITLPVAEADGLPVGVQIASRPAAEGQLLALAAQLESAQPWISRRPPVS